MWKTIKDYPKYIINTEGIILSSTRKFKEVKHCVDKDGYLYVVLSNSGLRKKKRVHRLVAEAFLLKTNPLGNIVHHKDGNRKNNNLQNLEWTTIFENNFYGIKYGGISQKGEKNKNHKLTNLEVIEIKRRLGNGEKYIDIYKDFNVTATTIGRIARKENWKHIR